MLGLMPKGVSMKREPLRPGAKRACVDTTLGFSIIVHELTIGEFRNWLASISTDRKCDVLLALQHDGLVAADLPIFTNMELADVEKLSPLMIRQLWEEVKAINADLFGVLGKPIEADRQSDRIQNSHTQS